MFIELIWTPFICCRSSVMEMRITRLVYFSKGIFIPKLDSIGAIHVFVIYYKASFWGLFTDLHAAPIGIVPSAFVRAGTWEPRWRAAEAKLCCEDAFISVNDVRFSHLSVLFKIVVWLVGVRGRPLEASRISVLGRERKIRFWRCLSIGAKGRRTSCMSNEQLQRMVESQHARSDCPELANLSATRLRCKLLAPSPAILCHESLIVHM